MDVKDILWRLAQLCSLPFQERYVIGGTADEYIVGVELLENVDSLKYIVRRRENFKILTEAQRSGLEDLFAYIEAQSGAALSAGSRDESAKLIREGAVWKGLRANAAVALRHFGLSPEMSVQEIERLSGQARVH